VLLRSWTTAKYASNHTQYQADENYKEETEEQKFDSGWQRGHLTAERTFCRNKEEEAWSQGEGKGEKVFQEED
jgi:hypothetical protein